MRAIFGLGVVALVSGCFVGETLDGAPAPPDQADVASPAASASPTPESDASPASSEAGVDAAPRLDAGAPPPFDAGAVDTGPCGSGDRPVSVHVSGGAGTITSNPPGIAVATGGTTTACFPIARAVVLQEVNQTLCNWSGASCKDGNTADRRCEFVVPDGVTSIAVVVP